MAWHKMKPETIERRKRQHEAERIKSRAVLIDRLRAKAQEHGENSIYAEMLAETLSRT